MQLLAGTGTVGFTADNGPATSAQIVCRFFWVHSSGNIFIPDSDSHRIRKVTPAGIITTVGGTGTSSSVGTGGALETVSFFSPFSIVGDMSGNTLYISDGWYVWKYVITTNIVSVYAGTSVRGYSGDNGFATSAQINEPLGIWFTSSGDLVIAEYAGYRIRKVASNNIINTLVGTGTKGKTGDGGPALQATLYSPRDVYVDSVGKLFIADTDAFKIRVVDTNNMITSFAGTGYGEPYNGLNPLPAVSATLLNPESIRGDSLGNIYVADTGNCLVRVININGIISNVFGNHTCGFTPGPLSPATSSRISTALGLWIDSVSGTIYFGDYTTIHRSVVVSTPVARPSLFFRLFAGTGNPGFANNGQATTSQIKTHGMWIDSQGSVYLADTENARIRRINDQGIISSFGGTGTESTTGSTGSSVASVGLYHPWSVVGDTNNNLYISDAYYIWIYSFNNNIISVFAGTATLGLLNGIATSAQLNGPMGLWLTTSGVLYFADNLNHRVRKITSGIISTVAGSSFTGSFSGDNGPAISATLNEPRSVYVNSLGLVFIADYRNNVIRKVDTNNIITTFAGTYVSAFNGDNLPATIASLYCPEDVKGDSAGNIYYRYESLPNSCGRCVGIHVDSYWRWELQLPSWGAAFLCQYCLPGFSLCG
jgi:sugar lactone lactonase YvrE